MKFNWGTGIFLFLVVFVVALLSFVFFASQQQINLVHQDYYEKGVDYTEQMQANERGQNFLASIFTEEKTDQLLIRLDRKLAATIDSGNVLLFRPSDKDKDISKKLAAHDSILVFSKTDLLKGRYLLKLSWYNNGERYEVKKTINIQP